MIVADKWYQISKNWHSTLKSLRLESGHLRWDFKQIRMASRASWNWTKTRLNHSCIIYLAKYYMTKGEYYSQQRAGICYIQGAGQQWAKTSYSTALVISAWDLSYEKKL